LFGQAEPSGDACRVFAKQETEKVLLLFDGALGRRDDLRRAVDELLGLPHFEHVRHAALLPQLDDAQRLLARGQRAPGHLKLIVQLAQVEVSRRHVADQRGDDGFARLFARQQLGARRFGSPPQTAPYINLECQQVEQDAAEGAVALDG
jgi:hypothetical protein